MGLDQIRKRIAAAEALAGRAPGDVTLIAVSKTKPVPMLQEAYDAGARDFGENKVQEITDPLMQQIRYLDKLVDEVARGKAMEKILRA